ncbi:hypothetical protein [Natrinema sp. SYSU A 869]|uniref:hypothetical protein n=1 Tax=Natrinema sp. SYSU A 869 TaxID=2871694 RepID=UPI001CA43665|nr:hypothetical protein [Natrinema sp. SYSU A 869]
MGKPYRRRNVLAGVSAGFCFLSGCVGEQESDGDICTFSTETAFKTDYIESLNYMGTDTDDGDFHITIIVELDPSRLNSITIYNKDGSEVVSFAVTDDEMELSWDVDERPSDRTFELVAYDSDEEIDRSIVRAECK